MPERYNVPKRIRGLIFDIDNTLYENPEYIREQVEGLIRRLAGELGRNENELTEEIDTVRRQRSVEDGGRRPSLGTTFKEYYDVSIAKSVGWREELMEPERFLSVDSELRGRLESLSVRLALCAVTNNPLSIGRRTLAALGISDLLPVASGLDTCAVSKPSPRPFELALEFLAVPPTEVLAIGDRYEIDLEPIVDLGGGGALVGGRDDLLSLLDGLLEDSLG